MTPLTRRDVLFGLGGGIAGTLLSPLPWTVLDDVAIWTQHRRALPIPRDGETSVRPVACTSCPAGCSLRVRSVAGRPVFVSGEASHPLGGGACPFGLTLHHLAHHPLRLTTPVRLDAHGTPTRVALGAAVAAAAGALRAASRSGRAVLVLDQRPGRAVSRAFRELLAAVPYGLYATPDGEGATLQVLSGAAGGPLGIDLEHTRTLLSFGAPVLEGWGRPGRMLALRDRLRIVQLDAWRSPTAGLADEWLAIRPGSEGPLALALANVLVGEGLARTPAAELRDLLASFPPERVEPLAGLPASAIETLARSLAAQGPTVAIGGGDPGGGPLPLDAERAIAWLDVVLGSVGRAGGLVARGSLPDDGTAPLAPETSLAEVPDGDVRLLVIAAGDSGRALPWSALGRKLAPQALVVSLSPFRCGLTARADLVVPSPAPLEGHEEILPTADACVMSYAVTAPLLPPCAESVEPTRFLAELARAAGLGVPSDGTHAERLQRRAAAIFASHRGRVLVRGDEGFREEAPADAGAFWQALLAGGCWVDDSRAARAVAAPALPSPAAVAGWLRAEPARSDLPLVSFAARGAVGGTPPSPILTKLYQETALRPSVATIALHPQTARERGLVDGREMRVVSAAGRLDARLRCDPTLPPGRAAMAAGPDPAALHEQDAAPARGALALGVVEPDLTWRGTRVAITEA